MIFGNTYSKQTFHNEAFRHFVNIFLNKNNGITKGCEITYTNTNITIGSGYFVIQGGLMREMGGSTLELPNETGYYKLVFEIDLGEINGVEEFNQGKYKFLYGRSAYPTLTKEDLDGSGEIYQLPFAQFRITSTGIADFKDIREILELKSVYDEIRQEIQNIKNTSDLAFKTKITTGQETATNTYIDGKMIYLKRINIGNLPNAGVRKTVPHGLDIDNIEVVEIKGITKRITSEITFWPIPINTMEVWITGGDVYVACENDRRAFTAFVDIYYYYK